MFIEDRRMTKDMWKKLLKDIDTNQDGFVMAGLHR
jgi:hypothetical protein